MYPGTISEVQLIPLPLLQPKPSMSGGITVHPIRVSGAPSISYNARPLRRRFEISATCRPSTVAVRSIASLPPLHRPTIVAFSEERTAAMAGRRGAAAALLVVVAASLFGSSAMASPSEEAFVKKTVSSHDIVIFSKTYCPYCRRAKAVFKELNKVPYVVELDEREDGQDIQDALDKIVGRRTVPQVFISGKHLGGSDDTVEAYESGRLAKLLGIDSNADL